MTWILIVVLVIVIILTFRFMMAIQKKEPAPPPTESYVCDVCGQEDCLCRKEHTDFEA